MIRYGIVTHGGAGAPAEWRDGTEAAAEIGFRILESGGCALDAVVEAAASLEADGRFNAGRGAVLRLDGRTIETDAAVMTSDGRIGAVAAVRDVPHPIRLALRVLETPHVLLAGEGARRFAELHGLVEPFGPSPHAREAYERCRARAQAEPDRWLPHWNFATAPDVPAACDTIGAVAMDREGRLAVANSTGGASPMLLGRVGDSPLVGCGFYCSPAAAVAATGHGETIIRHMLSRAAHDHIAQGDTAERALARALAKMGDAPAGLIAIHRGGVAGASNRTMPCSFRVAARG